MSGSSLDGLDVCLVQFVEAGEHWDYQILEARTIKFPLLMAEKLASSAKLNQSSLVSLDAEFGQWIGNNLNEFTQSADLIGLHGHTVRHDPENQISLQIGNGQVIANLTGHPTVVNFRMADILSGGQGAPLVPLGEKLLFPQYDGFLNLGGICNASIRLKDDQWIAGDIGPFNQVLNHYARKLGNHFDNKGNLARSGNMDFELYEKWTGIGFFEEEFPKSLSNDWVQNHFFHESNDPKDTLTTFTSFITDQIAKCITQFEPKKLLISGGGAFNLFAVDLLREKIRSEIVIPESEIIQSKEALIFGLLALLRFNNLPNVMASCTGATKNTSGGDIFFPQ